MYPINIKSYFYKFNITWMKNIKCESSGKNNEKYLWVRDFYMSEE